jgi:hypothetical protein
MANCEKDPNRPTTIAEALVSIGPRTVEGDQGRVSMHSVHDAIAAIEYERKRTQLRDRASIRRAMLTISNHRLATHDGPAS